MPNTLAYVVLIEILP